MAYAPPVALCPGNDHHELVPCKGCILLVDDDPDLRDGLTECFQALGCTVVAAVDGVHAVERLGDSLKPCLALLDLNMPRLDGAGLAAFVRAHRSHCGLPLVSMSGGSDRLAPPLVEAHHTKPFGFDALLPSVEKFCQDPDWLHGIR
jgi:CheY-like chemotaxis protein